MLVPLTVGSILVTFFTLDAIFFLLGVDIQNLYIIYSNENADNGFSKTSCLTGDKET